MSYRIHKAIGWGLTDARMNTLCRFPLDPNGGTQGADA